MPATLTFALTAFSSLFAIVDPFAAVPVYLALTGSEPDALRRRNALRAAATTFFVLTTFALGGQVIFRFFGITLPAFKIAGGFLLFTIALEMLRAKPSTTRTTPEETEEGAHKADIGVVPVGIPLLSGPGAIASATLLSEHARTLPLRVALVAAILALAALVWVTLRFAGPVARVLGKTGLNLIARIMGLLLAAVAVQFVIDGAHAALAVHPPSGTPASTATP